MSYNCQFPFFVNIIPDCETAADKGASSFAKTNQFMRTNLKALFFCLLLVVNVFANEEERGSINGRVTTSDGQPAAAVTILIKGTRRSALTDEKGNFSLKNIPAGNYQLEISLIGYETTTKEVVVADKQSTAVALQLNLSKKELQTVVISSARSKYTTGQGSSSLRLTTPLLEVPQNIQVVTAANLADQQVISMSDGLIRNVSGLVRLEHWGDVYTNITARGSQIQAFRNGFNVVSSYWGPLTEDMSFVDHIEFVKGPAGFMLASGEPSGMYNVVTKKPTGQTKGEFNLTVGSFDLYRSSLDLDGKLSKDGRLLYRFNLAAQNKKSHRANEYNNRYTLAPVISYQLDDKTKLTLEYNYQRADMSNVGSYYVYSPFGYGTLPREATQLPAGSPGTKINDHSVYANIQHDINANWKLTGQVARFVYNQEGTSMWPTAVNPDGTMIRSIGIWDVTSNMTMGQAFLNGDVTTGAVRHRILAGVDLSSKEYYADWGQTHDLDTVGGEFNPWFPDLGIPNNGYPVFDRTTPLKERAMAAAGVIQSNYSSLYAQDELGFADNRIRLTLAGRWTSIKQSYYGTQEAKHFTPRIGLSVSVDKNTSAYALYDQAFTPQAGLLLYGGKVQPLTGNNMEIGIKRNMFGGKWNTTLAVYRILKNNELVSAPPTATNPNPIGLSIELGQKRAQGVEFDLRGTIINGLNVVANYAFTEATVTKVAKELNNPGDPKVGDLVPSYSKHTANAWVNYKIHNGALKGTGISAGFTYLAGRVTYWEIGPDPDEKLADYFKLDGGLFWENDKVKINLNVFNVLDEYLYSGSYYSYPAAYNWQTDPPRNVRLSIAYSF